MNEDQKQRIQTLINRLKQERDEIALKIHLGQQELKDEWKELQGRLDQLNDRYAPLKEAAGDTAEGVWTSLKLLGDEVKSGFDRIRKSLGT